MILNYGQFMDLMAAIQNKKDGENILKAFTEKTEYVPPTYLLPVVQTNASFSFTLCYVGVCSTFVPVNGLESSLPNLMSSRPPQTDITGRVKIRLTTKGSRQGWVPH